MTIREAFPATGPDSTRDRIGCSWEHKPPRRRSSRGLVVGENDMKILISIFVAALALTFIGPTFAEEVPGAKTEAACQKAGGVWDAKTKVCSEKKSY